MAPRKRRGRSSSTPAQKSAPPGSTSNSAGTSSHSSPPVSKSNREALAPSTRNPSDPVLRSKNTLASDPPSQPISTKIRSKPTRLASDTANTSREPSVSIDRTVNEGGTPTDCGEKELARAQSLLETYQETTASGAGENQFTVAAVAVHLYEDMINWAVSEVAVQFKRNVFLSAEADRQRAALATGAGSSNTQTTVPKIASRLLYSEKNVTVECSNCGSNISASRYAQHMEKCLGRGGRMSSRAASARLRASAERAEKEAAADLDDHPVRRRRHSSADATMEGGSFGGGTYSKRRKMSPVPSGGSVSQAGSLQHSRAGLPPSGRTRASPP